MRVDQRAPVVTALAILSHLLRRYTKSHLATSEDWLEAMRQQFGEDALVLAEPRDEGERALLVLHAVLALGVAGREPPIDPSLG